MMGKEALSSAFSEMILEEAKKDKNIMVRKDSYAISPDRLLTNVPARFVIIVSFPFLFNFFRSAVFLHPANLIFLQKV